MKIVVDTNLVFSAILNTHNLIGDILLNSHPTFEFYTCHLLIDEMERHKSKIITAKKFSEGEYELIKKEVFRHIHFLSEEIIPFEFWNKVIPLVRDVDMDDIAFVALNEFLGTKLWTGDRRLILGLQSKGYKNIVSTDEMFALRKFLER